MFNGINDSALNQFLQRRLNITDSPAPAGSLAPEIFPVIQALAPSEDDHFLQGTRMCGAKCQVAAVAANYSGLILQNPTGSGMIVCVDELVLGVGGNGVMIHQFVEAVATMPGLGALGAGVRDSRWGVTAATRSAAIFRAGNDPAAIPLSWIDVGEISTYTANLPVIFRPEVVLAPGSFYTARNVSVNQIFYASLKWRERRAQPSELG